jgi:hypothetical protein
VEFSAVDHRQVNYLSVRAQADALSCGPRDGRLAPLENGARLVVVYKTHMDRYSGERRLEIESGMALSRNGFGVEGIGPVPWGRIADIWDSYRSKGKLTVKQTYGTYAPKHTVVGINLHRPRSG